MGKITNLDGSDASAGTSVEELTDDPRLRDLLHCATAGDVKALWLSRGCDREDVQVALLIQLVGDVQHLTRAIYTLMEKQEVLSTQSNVRH